ncbi:DNA-binding protein [Taklimakanibacter albus]|uniref:DNA-binding protein n=1 Tax=Taklimakanibacter albus TaxID=2800327 RepID=A0ACC5RAG5_9HYPH|nr:DNA-binding protein [Aestuariivirga sp. YIM B02566]MBK1869455.1 DNA-binding protein [Aestuariivirga sp. YIM B02566]
MTTQVLEFLKLSDRDRRKADAAAKLGRGDRFEVLIRQESGVDLRVELPAVASEAIQTLLEHLVNGQRVAILAEDQEISPNDAAEILGVSRPLVVHRMDVGDLPFRYVGKHRRAKLKDVLTLKARLDAQQEALDALAEDTESLMRDHGL